MSNRDIALLYKVELIRIQNLNVTINRGALNELSNYYKRPDESGQLQTDFWHKEDWKDGRREG